MKRSDLQVAAMSSRPEAPVVVKDPLCARYFHLPRLQFCVLESLNGFSSLQQIRLQVQASGLASNVTTSDIHRMILDLAGKHLIWSQRTGLSRHKNVRSDSGVWQACWGILTNPFFIRLPGLHPGQLLKRTARHCGWIYSTPAVAVSLAFIAVSWLFCLMHLDQFLTELPFVSQPLTPGSLLTLWIVVAGLKIVHEISHGLACEHFGAECQSIGLAFLFFSPCLYCDVTDAWMLPKKWSRIAVSLAGVYVELMISALCLWLWWFSAVGTFHEICLQVFLAGSAATVLLNANPLMRFDGYYVLADLLQIPNLYQHSRQAIKRMAGSYMLGIRQPIDSVASRHDSTLILLGYGLASIAYQTPMLVGLVCVIYQTLETIGLTPILIAYLASTLSRSGYQSLKWVTEMIQRQKSTRHVIFRSFASASLVALALVGIWNCPLSGSITVPLVVEPQFAQTEYVETPGIVRSLFVREGDHVEQGDVLAELEDKDLDRRIVSLEGLLQSHQTDLKLSGAISDPDLMVVARTAIESCQTQIELARHEKDRLQLRASISGKVISTRDSRLSRDRPDSDATARRTASLDSCLIGSYLPKRTSLCEIAPGPQWQAVAWIDQKNRQYVSIDQPIQARLDAYSGIPVRGKVVTLAAANQTQIPAVVSNKFGGQITTVAAAAGEKPSDPIYAATLQLAEIDCQLQAGMRGTCRISCPTATVGSWLVEEFHRQFVFR